MEVRLSLCLLLVVMAKACDNNGPLGMISGEIQDWQIQASSSYPSEWDPGCAVANARMYSNNGKGWCTYYKSSSEWIQIDLGVPTTVTGVMTEGRGDGREWVTSYYLSYSNNGEDWSYVLDHTGSRRVFEGNSDSYSAQHAYLEQPLHTRFVKLHPHTWNNHPSMRLELLGCKDARQQIGLPPYGHMTASSSHPFRKQSSCQPENGNINSVKSWCSRETNEFQWLQVDVGPPSLITGVITRGRGDTGRRHWVTQYTLSYSNDTVKWYPYRETGQTSSEHPDGAPSYDNLPNKIAADGKVEFGGNTDKDTERVHYLASPFIARYIRVHPTAWKGAISMRVGLLGKLPTGDCGSEFLRLNEKSPCVENIAYKKSAYISDGKHSKRNLEMPQSNLVKAVDGIVAKEQSSCMVLDSYEGSDAKFTIDLGEKRDISGVVMALWHSEKRGTDDDYVRNLNSISVYVEEKKVEQLCAQVKNINGALYQDMLHLPCSRSRKGRFLRIVVQGKAASQWPKPNFSAVICEVMAYS